MKTRIIFLLFCFAVAFSGCADNIPPGWVRMKVRTGNPRPRVPTLALPASRAACEIPILDLVVQAPDLDYTLRYPIYAEGDDADIVSSTSNLALYGPATYEILVPQGDARQISLEGVAYGDATCADPAATAYPIFGISAPFDVSESGTLDIMGVMSKYGFTYETSVFNSDPTNSEMVNVVLSDSGSPCITPVLDIIATDWDAEFEMTASASDSFPFYVGLFLPDHLYSIDLNCNGTPSDTCFFFTDSTYSGSGSQPIDINTDCL